MKNTVTESKNTLEKTGIRLVNTEELMNLEGGEITQLN